MLRVFILGCMAALLLGCEPSTAKSEVVEDSISLADYYDTSGRDDVWTGGIKMIPVETASGTFNVYTKRTGNNPKIKLLLLHGGPGNNHEYFLSADSYFPGQAIEYYYYDQLGSNRSDAPKDTSLWNIPRFVEEVEQVRQALGLGPDNFFLLGHSWGGILGIEYALKHQDKLKGLIISNMMSSCPAYGQYAHDVLGPGLGEEVYSQIKAFEESEDFSNPAYMELMESEHYTKHVLRRPLAEWPAIVLSAFSKTNPDIYVPMQGPSEFGIRGKLANWDRTKDLPKIKVPTLVVGAQYDTMDPEFMKMMADELPDGEYLHCPNGSHMAMWDDQETYYNGITDWLKRKQ